MYRLIALLLALIAALQYRLWLGDGGIHEYREAQMRLADMAKEIERLRIRNAALAADVEDLKNGSEAIEERARHELGMVRQGETYVQVYETPDPDDEANSVGNIVGDASVHHPESGRSRQKSAPATQASTKTARNKPGNEKSRATPP